MNADACPLIIRRVLCDVCDGPNAFSDLLEAYEVMTDEFCRQIDPGCSRDGVLEWFLTLGPQRQNRLLREINSDLAGRQAPRRPPVGRRLFQAWSAARGLAGAAPHASSWG